MLKFLMFLGCAALIVGYDDLDVKADYDGMANNITELKIHLNCFIKKGPCDDSTQHYRSHIIEAINTLCANCTRDHKHKAHAFLRGLLKNLPEGYAEFRRFYDPDDTKFAALEAELDKY